MKKGLSNIWILHILEWFLLIISIFLKDLTPLLFNMKTKKKKENGHKVLKSCLINTGNSR